MSIVKPKVITGSFVLCWKQRPMEYMPSDLTLVSLKRQPSAIGFRS